MYQEYTEELANIPQPSVLVICLLFFIIGFFALSIISYVLYMIFDEAPFVLSFLIWLTISCILLSGFISWQEEKLAEAANRYKEKAPIEWVLKQEEQLYPLATPSDDSTGTIFVNQLFNSKPIDYMYMVKTASGYQVKTISEQFEDLKENDLFIQEEGPDTVPKIIIEQQTYKEKAFNKVFKPTKKRVIFVVPKGTVSIGNQE